jgi:hypothetical protein
LQHGCDLGCDHVFNEIQRMWLLVRNIASWRIARRRRRWFC